MHYKGKTVADVLDMPIEEAAEFFAPITSIARYLRTLVDVGLGYVRLGQPAPTLSGGEAQRVKLASELQKRSNGRTVYILDEPTTGLHFEDIRKLLAVINGLVDKGNTVIVIEHNLDVIKTSDWIIDMGPEGGSGGGTVVAQGTPEQIAAHPDSYTGQFLRHLVEPEVAARAAAQEGRQLRANRSAQPVEAETFVDPRLPGALAGGRRRARPRVAVGRRVGACLRARSTTPVPRRRRRSAPPARDAPVRRPPADRSARRTGDVRWTYGGTRPRVLPTTGQTFLPPQDTSPGLAATAADRPATRDPSYNSVESTSEEIIMVPRDPALGPPGPRPPGCHSPASAGPPPAATAAAVRARGRPPLPARRSARACRSSSPGPHRRAAARCFGSRCCSSSSWSAAAARTSRPRPPHGRAIADERRALRRRPLATAAADRHRRRPLVGGVGGAEVALGAVPAHGQRLPDHHLRGRPVVPRGPGRPGSRARHLARPGPRPGHRRARRWPTPRRSAGCSPATTRGCA